MDQLDELGLILGVHHVRLATETELGVLFPGCELGAMPPFGNLFGLPVYLAAELANEEFFSFNGGTHRDLIHMEMRDFRRLARPVIADIAVAAPVA
jgi:Ala-tRNA(Pro) deacylase